MDRDELVRLAGEQALLKQELTRLTAEQHREMLTLQNLHNDVARKANWLEGGIALLRRLDERQRTTTDIYRRLSEFKKLTGIE
ncbi:MAG: hypothetical protein K9K35_10050 [Rhodoferax sp.]|nr:hypothetical protein [Rhodoferax sp.]